MKKIIKLLMIILSGLCLFSACNALSDTISLDMSPANEFTQIYEPLNQKNNSSLAEVINLSSKLLNSPLLKVGYLPEDNFIIGVYENGGALVGWDLETAEISFSHETGIVTSKGLSFISSGENLVGARQHTMEPYLLNQELEYIDAIALWDVRTGKIIKCITYPCQELPTLGDGFAGVSVSNNGKWLVIYSESGIGVSGIPEDSPSFYYALHDVDFSYPWHIGSVVFDEQHRRYVIIFHEGRIYLSEDELSTDYRMLRKGKEADIVPITDAQIDPTGRWLVVARGETTQVFSLNNGKALLEVNVSNPVMAFDQTGELLFVGSTNNLTIYSVETGEKTAHYDTVGITSLAISEDNRIVIWGDTLGQIHVWAKPSSNR